MNILGAREQGQPGDFAAESRVTLPQGGGAVVDGGQVKVAGGGRTSCQVTSVAEPVFGVPSFLNEKIK